MRTVKVQFDRPVTLTAADSEQATFGKGLHQVDDKFTQDWFFAALVTEGHATVLTPPVLVPVIEAVSVNLNGNTKSVLQTLSAVVLSMEELIALRDAEAIGGNRASVLRVIDQLIAARSTDEAAE